MFEGDGTSWMFLGLSKVTSPTAGEVALRFTADARGLLSVSASLPGGAEGTLALSRAQAPASAPAILPQDLPPQSPSGFMRAIRKLFNR